MLKASVLGIENYTNDELQIILSLKNIKVIGYFTIDSISCEKKMKKNGLKHFPNTEEMIASSDIIIVNTIGDMAFPVLEEAIKHSRHIFFQEYIRSNPEKISHLIRLSLEANVVVFVNNTIHKVIPTKEIHEQFPNPIHLSYYYSSKNCSPETIEKKLWEMFDILLELNKSSIKKSLINGISSHLNKIEFIKALYELDNGTFLSLTIDTICHKDTETLHLYNPFQHIEYNIIDKNEKNVIKKAGKPETNTISLHPGNDQIMSLVFEEFFHLISAYRHDIARLERNYILLQLYQQIEEKTKKVF